MSSKALFFIYRDQLHMKVVPCKALLRSTTIYEVLVRGDIFAVNMKTNVLTVVPKNEIEPTQSTMI